MVDVIPCFSQSLSLHSQFGNAHAVSSCANDDPNFWRSENCRQCRVTIDKKNSCSTQLRILFSSIAHVLSFFRSLSPVGSSFVWLAVHVRHSPTSQSCSEAKISLKLLENTWFYLQSFGLPNWQNLVSLHCFQIFRRFFFFIYLCRFFLLLNFANLSSVLMKWKDGLDFLRRFVKLYFFSLKR